MVKKLTIKDCYKCINSRFYKKKFFSCGSVLCELGLKFPCKACAYYKENKKVMFFNCKYYKKGGK